MRTSNRKFAFAVLLLAPALFLWLRCESTPPHARLLGAPASPGTAAARMPAPLHIGSAGLRVVFEAGDVGSGLRRARLRLLHIDGEGVLFERHYPGSRLFGGEPSVARRIEATLEPRALGLAPGGAMLILDTWDWSLASWLRGNHSVLETPLRIAAEEAVRRDGGAASTEAAAKAGSEVVRRPGGAVSAEGAAQAESAAVKDAAATQAESEAAARQAGGAP